MNILVLKEKIWGKINPLRYWDLLICHFRKDEDLIQDAHDFPHDFSEKLCIFSSFSKNEIIQKSIYFQLQAIRNESYNIFFVSTSPVSKNDIKHLGEICSKVIIKKNSGYDWGAYLTGIKAENYKLRKQLLFMNDSVLGPLFPLWEMFQKMSKNACDCWGITDSYEKRYHIQSYFFVIKQRLLRSKEFESFWSNFRLYSNRLNVVKKYELGFSQYLTKNGFKLDAYIPYKSLCWPFDKVRSNATHYFWKELILKYRCPFIKKNFVLKNPMRIKDHSEWEHVIRTHTDYNIDLTKNINQEIT